METADNNFQVFFDAAKISTRTRDSMNGVNSSIFYK